MTANVSDLNSSANTKTSDFDGFLNEPPYCYGWTTNAKGVKVPVFPYVISILGHLNLKKLGVPPEEEERSTELMKNTLAVYLEQVIKQWRKRHFWQKKIDLPLIILINIADKIGELVTDVVEKLQVKYPFVRLIAVLPLPKNEFINQLKAEGVSGESIKAFELRYKDFEENENENNQKFIWELSEREMPHIADQPKLKKWRMFNEFVAQHSHLMIVFWQGEKDNWKDQDDSLTWAVRYKLEGYPGLSRNEQTDLITYPAMGPVLHIQTDSETLQNSDNYLPARYYSDRAIITKEIDGRRKLIISDSKFWNLEQLRHTWWGRKFSDIGNRPEINNNCEILKDLNYACQNKRIPLNNQSLRSFIEEYVIKRYQKSGKTIEKNNIPETDNPTGQLIAHYCILDKIADYYKNKTYRLINLFCGTFLMLLVFNALLLFLNDICTMGFGVNIIHLSHYYVAQWLPEQQLPVDDFYWEQLAGAINQYLPSIAPDEKLNALIGSQTLNISRIISAFWVFSFAVSLCIITIFYCCIASLCNSWHYKYHQFRTLADCLRVQVFWKIGGMDYSVSANFRSHQIPAMDWLLMALNGLNITIPNSEKIESTQILKERIKMLDTIWIEDRMQFFERIFKRSKFKLIFGSLTLFSKLIAVAVLSLIPFLIAFFVADFGCNFGIQSFMDVSLKIEGRPFMDSIKIASITTGILWLLVFVWIFAKSIRKWLEHKLKWSEEYYHGFYGFFGNIYRRIKQQNKSKRYFLVPFITKIFHASIIIIVCFGVFFEINRLNLICDAAQCPSFKHLYNPWMAFRLVLQIFISVMAIWWLYNRMGLFTKARRRIEQLYYPFAMADYSIDMLMDDKKAVENINSSMWDNITSWFGFSSKQNSQIAKNIDDDDKVKLCQQVLLELGQEVLAKRADWLLAVTDRNLQSPK